MGVGPEHGDPVDLAGEHVGGGARAGDVGGARDREAAVRALGAAQAEVRDRVALGRLDHARGLRGDERLEVHEVKKRGLDELAVDDGAHDADHRLAGEDDLSLGHRVDGEVEPVPAEILEEAGLEHGAAARGRERGKVVHVLVVEHEVLDELGDLPRAAGDAETAAEGVLAEERVEAGLRADKARLPEPLGHGQLIEVGVQADVGRLGAVGERHGVS